MNTYSFTDNKRQTLVEQVDARLGLLANEQVRKEFGIVVLEEN
jgi:hypothetical protein